MAAKKTSSKKSTAKKASSAKSTAKKTSSKKSAAKKSTSGKGRAKVSKVMHEYKTGELKSGSGKKLTNRKQAVAVALSEARRAGAKIPSKKGKR